jgi:hypothetical protein
MINVVVFSSSYVEIEQVKYEVHSQEDFVNFLKALLDKVHYSGETICLESATIDNDKGSVNFQEIDRWK